MCVSSCTINLWCRNSFVLKQKQWTQHITSALVIFFCFLLLWKTKLSEPWILENSYEKPQWGHECWQSWLTLENEHLFSLFTTITNARLCTGQTGFWDFAEDNYPTWKLYLSLVIKSWSNTGGFWYYEHLLAEY